MNWDVIVVGGGLAGLTSAAYLGRAGKRVLLLERAENLGGRGTSRNHEGFDFSSGLHALYGGGAAAEVLGDLGVEISAAPAPIAGALVSLEGSTHAMPVGFVTLMASDLLGFAEKVEAAKVLYEIDRAPIDSVPELPLSVYLAAIAPTRRVREVVAAILRTVTYSRSARLVSARVAVRQMRRASRDGVRYLHGGWAGLTAGLARAALHAGVDVRVAQNVERVVHDGRVRGVVVSGQRVACDKVVLAVGPRAAESLTGEDLGADSLVPMRASCLDVALTSLPVPRHRFVVGVDEPFFFNVQSEVARLAPEGAALASVVEYLEPGEHGDRGRLEAVFDRLQPGWRQTAVRAQFLRSITVMGAHPTPGTGRGVTTHVPGLFVCGDWITSGVGEILSDAALGSGREAAHHAVEDSGHEREPARARVA